MSTVEVSPADLAVDALIVRHARIIEWADDLDHAYWGGDAALAVTAVSAVHDAWEPVVPIESDGPVVLGCFVEAVFAAVVDAAFTYASCTQHPVSSEHITNVPRCLR